jgi:hypothetical protein
MMPMHNSQLFCTKPIYATAILIFLLAAGCSTLKNKRNDAIAENTFGASPIAPFDTIHVGSGQSFESLEEYFATDGQKAADYIIVHEGTYYSNQLWVEGENIVIEGQGKVNLYCKTLYENVMWITGTNIHVKNIHMKHFVPGNLEGQNCSGRVIGFDGAHDITIEKCDLNGCGLAGLHDNLGNSNILIKNNYIHNNSIGAYTNIDGGVWMEEIDDHPVFHFEKNRMQNNGPDRLPENDSPRDYIVSCPVEYESELINEIENLREQWKEVPNPLRVRYRGYEMGDYNHLLFEDEDGKVYDFGSGNNDFGDLQALFDDYNFVYDPAGEYPLYKLFWRWKVSTFPCCSGEYELVEAYQPSVIKIEEVKGD